ncbi:MAG: thiamine pyrophosphate-dependent enzyme [Bradyrhizobium sp.]
MKLQQLEPSARMQALEVEDADWSELPPAEAKRLATLILAARRFEEAIFKLDKMGLVHGPAHSSIGQDAAGAGSVAALPRNTKINGTHRSHHQCIAKAINTFYADDFDPTQCESLTEDMQREMRRMMCEILGLKDGWNGGRGGSMHMRSNELGIMGTDGIVAGGLPLACGIAFAEKVRNTGMPVVTYFGDGALHQGAAQEAMGLAALYNLPLIFFLENNHYAVSMSVEQSTREQVLLTRPMAHGIPSIRVDGMNPLAVWLGTRWAHRQILENGGPVFVEAVVYRYYHQSRPFPGSAFGYRTKEEEDVWRARDPIEFIQREFPARKILSTQQIEAIDRVVRDSVDAAFNSIVEGQGSASRIRPELWPDPSTCELGITGDLSELAGVRYAEACDFTAEQMTEMSLIEVLPKVVGARMAEDADIYVFGEDVANMNGGTVGATRGLPKLFPGRIVNTPITENGFCGLANGAAMSGLKPVIELMYSDFLLVAADQLFNHSSKMRHMFGGHHPMPLVLRCRIPGMEGYGAQHSMDPAGIAVLYPGWRIVAPSNAFDYVGLMNSALACKDPVLVLEHQGLHGKKTAVPKDLDYYIPIGKARKVLQGHQITLLTTLAMVEVCREVVEEMGVSADVIDLRTLSLRDLDYDMIGESICKTGNVAIVEQTTRGTSIGSHIADEIQRRYFDYLDQPVMRVTGGWAPPTVSKVLEPAALAGRKQVWEAVESLLHNSAQKPAQGH